MFLLYWCERRFIVILLWLLLGYSFILRKTGIYKYISRNDTLFKCYIVPFRIVHTLRRRLMCGFSHSYLYDVLTQRKILHRLGQCNLCGSCCKGCNDLVTRGNEKICHIYSRREWCDVYFPVSQEQLTYFTKKHGAICGYYFDSKDACNLHQVTEKYSDSSQNEHSKRKIYDEIICLHHS